MIGVPPMRPSHAQQNLYEIIGVPESASRDRIEARCIQLGERYRPDKNPGDFESAREFALIENAYETLLDPGKRAAYDAELHWQNAKPVKRKSHFGSATVIASALAILVACGYVFAYRPYIAYTEQIKRLAAEDARRVADARAKAAAEEKARIVEAQSRVVEARARTREAEARARTRDAEARAANQRAIQAEERVRAKESETAKMASLAKLVDAEDLARVYDLRDKCNASAGASSGRRSAVANFAGAQLAMGYCTQYERAAKDRQRYEAIRQIDPFAAARELEAQRVARVERQRIRPVVTNCNALSPGYATCISQ